MMAKTRASKLKNNAVYDEAHTKRYNIKLNLSTDADIIDALDSASSKQGFIKEAIRFYIASKK